MAQRGQSRRLLCAELLHLPPPPPLLQRLRTPRLSMTYQRRRPQRTGQQPVPTTVSADVAPVPDDVNKETTKLAKAGPKQRAAATRRSPWKEQQTEKYEQDLDECWD